MADVGTIKRIKILCITPETVAFIPNWCGGKKMKMVYRSLFRRNIRIKKSRPEQLRAEIIKEIYRFCPLSESCGD
jgi:hypothetical protein